MASGIRHVFLNRFNLGLKACQEGGEKNVAFVKGLCQEDRNFLNKQNEGEGKGEDIRFESTFLSTAARYGTMDILRLLTGKEINAGAVNIQEIILWTFKTPKVKKIDHSNYA